MAVYNLQTYQNARFYRKIEWKNPDNTPIDLTGYSAHMEIKETITSETVLKLTTDIDEDGKNNGITITPQDGVIEVNITTEQTRKLNKLQYIYDLFLIDTECQGIPILSGAIKNTLAVSTI